MAFSPLEHTKVMVTVAGSLDALPKNPDTPEDNIVFKMESNENGPRGVYFLNADAEWESLFKQVQVAQISGRWYCEPDNRWSGFPTAYGAATENYTQNGGTDPDPVVNWAYVGPLLRAGARVTGMRMGCRPSSPTITAMDIRLYFATGPWDGEWNTNAVTDWGLIYSVDGIDLPGTEWTRHIADIVPFTCPDDGYLLMFVRPSGVRTNRQYIYSSVGVEYEMA